MRTMLSLVLAVLAAGPIPAQEKKPEELPRPQMVGGKTFNLWLRDLRDKDPSVKRDAINAVQMFSDENEAAVKDLLVILETDDWALRCNAAIALNNVAIEPKNVSEVVKALTKQLQETTQINIRYHAAYTLGRFADDAQSAIPVLVPFAKNQSLSWEVRHACVQTLISVGKNKQGVIDARVTATLLSVLMQDKAAAIRHDAFMGLATMGTPSNIMLQDQVARQLQMRLSSSDKIVAVWSNFGLLAQRGIEKKLLKNLADLLRDGDVPTKMQSLRALTMLVNVLKGGAKDALAVIIDTLNDADPGVFSSACWSLRQLYQVVGIDDRAQTILTGIIKEEIAKEEIALAKAKKANPMSQMQQTPKHYTAQFTLDFLKGEIDPKTGQKKTTKVTKP